MLNNEDVKSLGFAAVVCVVVSLALATTASSLRPLQLANKELDRQKNVLMAVIGTDKVKAMTPEEVTTYFNEKIKEVLIDGEGNLLDKTRADYKDQAPIDSLGEAPYPLYVYEEDGAVASYIYKQYGMGLWSVVNSYIALEQDLATIRGVTFFDHGETPGLGGEVEKPFFTQRFVGKKLHKDGAPVEFVVSKAGNYTESDVAVEGVSGATITCQGVATFVNETYAKYNPYFDSIRGKDSTRGENDE